MPHLYPFIVNDPGEGSQAKRRTAAVIVDHLDAADDPVPSCTTTLARLETLVDEYALAADLDPRRAAMIAEDILSLARTQRLDADANDASTRDADLRGAARARRASVRSQGNADPGDGLHVFGRSRPRHAAR